MADKEIRPDWSEVSEYVDEQRKLRRAALVAEVQELGLRVVEENKGYMVLGTHQVAIFTTTHLGDFRWGWVEHLDGTGRTDFDNWNDMRASLAALAALRSPERTRS